MKESSDDDFRIRQSRFCTTICNYDTDLSDLLLMEEVEDKTTENGSGEATETRAKRGIEILPNEELQKRVEQRIPKNTRLSTEWSIFVWQDWAEERNSHQSAGHSKDDAYEKVPCDIVHTSDRELNYWLSKFVMQAVGVARGA